MRPSTATLCAVLCFAVPLPTIYAQPQILSFEVLTPQVARYGMCELRADVTGPWTNPFDPDQADISAQFVGPSGRTVSVPAFWYQAYAEEALPGKIGQKVDFVKLYVTENDWPAGTKLELFVDDVTLLRPDGSEVAFDDMEQGDATRWGRAADVGWSTEIVHGGKRSLRFAPTLAGAGGWPGAVRALSKVDWSGYEGMALWVYPRGAATMAPVQLYFHDSVFGNSDIASWSSAGGTLQPGKWTRLVWRWKPPAPRMAFAPEGKPEWRVRFTPTEVGQWSVKLRADAEGKTVQSESRSFTVTSSDSPGFVRVSPDDPHYFQFDNGKAFFPIGHDVPWRLADVRAYFPKMAAAGENATYFILCPWDLSIEWPTLGQYDLERAAQLDRVFDAARENGIYIKLSFDIHDALRRDRMWAQNPYSVERGGPCAGPADYFTSDRAWDFYRKRARYIAARWGYSPNLMAWEPVAELDGGTELDGKPGWRYPDRPGSEGLSRDLARFLERLARYLKTVDPNDRLFTTSYGSDVSDPRHWALPQVQYIQIHCYNVPDIGLALGNWTRKLTSEFRKPMMVTEFGWDSREVDRSVDPEGVGLHNGIWATTTTGAAGAALNWWWERIDALDLYRQYPPLKAFVEGVDWPREGFAPVQAAVQAPPSKTFSDVFVPAATAFIATGPDEFAIGADGGVQGGQKPPGYLLARSRTEPRMLPRFVVDYPVDGRFGVQVAAVCPDARLEFTVDGKSVRTVELPSQDVPGKACTYEAQYKLWRCDYNETFWIPVSAGRHEIRLENSHPGISWIRMTGYRLTSYASYAPAQIRCTGLTGRRTTLLWLQNTSSIWVNAVNAGSPPPDVIEGAQVSLSGLADGPVNVLWWDTWKGQPIVSGPATVTAGRLTLAVPPMTRDVACKIVRAG